jgi:hypothetical protein
MDANDDAREVARTGAPGSVLRNDGDDLSGEPDPKSRSLARGERRRFRHKATKAEWERIARDKRGPCRVCCAPTSNGHDWGIVHLHHLVPRSQGGDDVPENIVPLHGGGEGFADCHGLVHKRTRWALRALRKSLTPDELAYVISKLGESGPSRLFGVKHAGN